MLRQAMRARSQGGFHQARQLLTRAYAKLIRCARARARVHVRVRLRVRVRVCVRVCVRVRVRESTCTSAFRMLKMPDRCDAQTRGASSTLQCGSAWVPFACITWYAHNTLRTRPHTRPTA